ncbi:uncharacterized protein isoform X2 [Leptinotarsa decemlineata]|uniref:uncharacterized protein isoform X2 n=1 Tax=Leptinotarsa decemlineata TaxID=7539 RepID=UPI003D30D797
MYWYFCFRVNTTITKFEDNFTIISNNKLPDSEQYLAILEEKLRKIKNDPNIIAQLSAKKEACMQQLLSGPEEIDEEILNLDEPVSSSQILRTIAPQKQALNHGEIVELVKHDQLKKENDLETEDSANSK